MIPNILAILICVHLATGTIAAFNQGCGWQSTLRVNTHSSAGAIPLSADTVQMPANGHCIRSHNPTTDYICAVKRDIPTITLDIIKDGWIGPVSSWQSREVRTPFGPLAVPKILEVISDQNLIIQYDYEFREKITQSAHSTLVKECWTDAPTKQFYGCNITTYGSVRLLFGHPVYLRETTIGSATVNTQWRMVLLILFGAMLGAAAIGYVVDRFSRDLIDEDLKSWGSQESQTTTHHTIMRKFNKLSPEDRRRIVAKVRVYSGNIDMKFRTDDVGFMTDALNFLKPEQSRVIVAAINLCSQLHK